jgi:hypothetical protein
MIPYWLVAQLVVQSAAVVATVVIEAPKTLFVAVSVAPRIANPDVEAFVGEVEGWGEVGIVDDPGV